MQKIKTDKRKKQKQEKKPRFTEKPTSVELNIAHCRLLSLASEFDEMKTKAGTIDLWKLQQQFGYLLDLHDVIKDELDKQGKKDAN